MLHTTGIRDGAMALIGTAIIWGINEYLMMPDSISGIFNNAIVNTALAAAVYPIYLNTGLEVYNVACDSETGSLYRSDLCALSR